MGGSLFEHFQIRLNNNKSKCNEYLMQVKVIQYVGKNFLRIFFRIAHFMCQHFILLDKSCCVIIEFHPVYY